MRRMIGLACGLAMLAGAPGAAAEGGGYAGIEAFWLEAGTEPPGEAVAGVLTLPMGWTAADPAIVVLRGRAAPAGLRNLLAGVAAEAGVAILDIALPPGRPDAAPGLLRDALLHLRGAFFAGPVAAVGHGEGAAWVMLLPELAAPPGEGYAAAGALEERGLRLRPAAAGAAPSWAGWSRTVCEALHAALDDPDPRFREACERALPDR